MAVYRGSRASGGIIVRKDCDIFSPRRSQAVWNHSPDGFNWGYSGSGPAQLALALLLEETDQETAVRLHQKFKFEHVSGWQVEWACTSEGIVNWIKAQGPPPDHFVLNVTPPRAHTRRAEDDNCCGH